MLSCSFIGASVAFIRFIKMHFLHIEFIWDINIYQTAIKKPKLFYFFFFKMRSSVLSRDLFRLSSQTPTMNRESPIFDCNFNIFFIDLTFVGERI